MTFAHIVCPHPPFIFGAEGEDISHRDDRYYLGDGNKFHGMALKPEVYVRGYRSQSVFITKRIEEVIDQILLRSQVPPILILQSDHGSGLRLNMQSKEKTDLRERMGILNAYYFPNRDYRGLYQEITPVNSFRVVLNTFFGRQARDPSRQELLFDLGRAVPVHGRYRDSAFPAPPDARAIKIREFLDARMRLRKPAW